MVKKIWSNKLGLTIGPFLLLSLAVGFAWASDDDLYSFIRLFDKIAITISDRYIAPVNSEKMIKAGIEGMMSKLDPYSRYLSGQDYYNLMKETEGEYVGVGLELKKRSDTLWVSSIFEGSPAYNSKIKIGDRLIKIDSVNVIGQTESECRNLLKGEMGSRIVISVRRAGTDEIIDLSYNREKIYINAIACWCIDSKNNGYIKISRFSDGSAQEVRHIVSLFIERGISGLILDLQDNPGGLLSEAVEIASIFLPKGVMVVETKGRNELSLRKYKTRTKGIYSDGPLVVVINNETASAAEIVAGAIQDHDRGLIVGTASFGKGLVQQVMQFADNSALKLTIAKYYTPSDRCIQKDSVLSQIMRENNSRKNILFFTNSGRPVFGGGGIIPDIYVDPQPVHSFLEEIISFGFGRDFALEYGKNVNVDENFYIDDKTIDEFFNYLNTRGYTYRNSAYKSFDDFVSESGGWMDEHRLAGHATAIKGILDMQSYNEMQSLKSQAKDYLYESFIEMYLGERKVYELVWPKTHLELIKASKLLNNPQIYSDLLVNFQ